MENWFLRVIVVAVLAGWLTGCVETSPPETLIEYRRSGGFAGLDDHLVIERSGASVLTRQSERLEVTLDSDTVAHLQALFEEADFSRLGREYLPSRLGSDLFEYVVVYEGHSVRTMDGAVPPSLESVLEALNQLVETQGDE